VISSTGKGLVAVQPPNPMLSLLVRI